MFSHLKRKPITRQLAFVQVHTLESRSMAFAIAHPVPFKSTVANDLKV